MISRAMVIVLMLTVNVPAFAFTAPAKNSGNIHVMYTNIDDIEATIYFDGTCADCSSIIHGKGGTTKITATGQLKRVNSNGTTTVKTWTASASGNTLYFDKPYYIANGYT